MLQSPDGASMADILAKIIAIAWGLYYALTFLGQSLRDNLLCIFQSELYLLWLDTVGAG